MTFSYTRLAIQPRHPHTQSIHLLTPPSVQSHPSSLIFQHQQPTGPLPPARRPRRGPDLPNAWASLPSSPSYTTLTRLSLPLLISPLQYRSTPCLTPPSLHAAPKLANRRPYLAHASRAGSPLHRYPQFSPTCCRRRWRGIAAKSLPESPSCSKACVRTRRPEPDHPPETSCPRRCQALCLPPRRLQPPFRPPPPPQPPPSNHSPSHPSYTSLLFSTHAAQFAHYMP